MIVTYSPDGGQARTWDYKAEDLPSAEAEDIEDAVGLTWDEFQVKLMTGGAKARRALLWVLLRRDTPGLRFSDVAYRMGELAVDFDAEELGRLRQAVADAKELDDDVRAAALSVIDAQGPAEAPKDRSEEACAPSA